MYDEDPIPDPLSFAWIGASFLIFLIVAALLWWALS